MKTRKIDISANARAGVSLLIPGPDRKAKYPNGIGYEDLLEHFVSRANSPLSRSEAKLVVREMHKHEQVGSYYFEGGDAVQVMIAPLSTIDDVVEDAKKRRIAIVFSKGSSPVKAITAQNELEAQAIVLECIEKHGVCGFNAIRDALRAAEWGLEDALQTGASRSILALKDEGKIYSTGPKGNILYHFGSAPFDAADTSLDAIEEEADSADSVADNTYSGGYPVQYVVSLPLGQVTAIRIKLVSGLEFVHELDNARTLSPFPLPGQEELAHFESVEHITLLDHKGKPMNPNKDVDLRGFEDLYVY